MKTPGEAALTIIGYLYVLRIPILLFALMTLAAAGGILRGLPGESLLRGVFDVGQGIVVPPAAGLWAALGTDLGEMFRFSLVTLAA
ncbi:MAG: hypothetical protein ACRD96_11710, partial [Bryobacteraceae bacterium]